VEIRRGDVVWIPPGPEILAWSHGNNGQDPYRIQEYLDRKAAERIEKVSD